MRRRRRREPRRILVPLDLATLFVPLEWRAVRGADRRRPIRPRPLTIRDLVVGIGVNLLLYGPWVLGGVIGWRVGHGWWPAALGVAAALVAQIALYVCVGPFLAFAKSRHDERASGPD